TLLNKPYVVNVDTADNRRRTQEINKPTTIYLQKKLSALNTSKFFLTSDSAGITVEAPLKVESDTSGRKVTLTTPWRENALYTLRLQKGFAKDSAGTDLPPSRYTFR